MKLEDDFELEEQPSLLGRVLVGVAVVFLFILLIFCVVFLLRKDKPEQSEESLPIQVTETPEPTEAPTPTPSPQPEPTATPEPNVEEGHVFREVEEIVTAKNATNLRNMPSQEDESIVIVTLKNGQTVTRIGISDTGWSKVEYKGEICYAVSNYLTTDLTPPTPVPTATPAPEEDGIKTVFTACDEMVSPKMGVNLRTLPSVTNPESVVVVKLPYGAVVKRTGINKDVGWSRVEYEGQTLYCISSYVYVVEE